MFFDRDKATKNLKEQLSVCAGWIVISGKLSIGKTAFVKNALTGSLYIYCEPEYEINYMREFCKQISIYARAILNDFSSNKIYTSNKYDEIIKAKVEFLNDLTDTEVVECIEEIIKKEYSERTTYFAKAVGDFLKSKVRYIILDNLFKCDISFYEWFVALSENFLTKNNHIIAVCDINTVWISENIKSTFNNMISTISINKFDNEDAYFQLLNDKIYFNNVYFTKRISKYLYNKFEGDSLKIFQLIDLSLNKIECSSDDCEKEKIILEQSETIEKNIFTTLNPFQKFILSAIATSPVSLSLKQLQRIIEHKSDDIRKELYSLITKNLIVCEFDIDKDETLYLISNMFSQQDFMHLIDDKMIFYIQKKLYSMHKIGEIDLSMQDYAEIAITINSSDLYSIIQNYIEMLKSPEEDELMAKIINKVIISTNQLFDYFKKITTADLLYKFGWYQSALRVIAEVEKTGDLEDNYHLLMKKGDIQHLLLHKETSETFKRASEIAGITVSQKLSAINRQIMAMTQQNQDSLNVARKLYKKTVQMHQHDKCNGLIELYRNANNTFSYDEAMKYTIKGYNMACELSNEIEKIKCIHNLCMLDLYNNTYLNSNYKLFPKPSFELVYSEITKLAIYRHESAYPLLDMGTVEMFAFIKDKNINHLQNARNYYSRAQLYAKSFYAINIAKMGLLIVNSYLYRDIGSLEKIRSNLYKEYKSQKSEIKDFRVHRKILFSLATSALITKHYDEGIKYLLESKEHVFEGETLRFNNLCDAFNISSEKIELNNLDVSNTTEYHNTIEFVPWLISFGH